MTQLDPVLAVLLASSAAAFVAALGVVPQALMGRLATPVLGWGNALASGLMLGVAYSLTTVQPDGEVLMGAGGAVVGMLFVRITHVFSGVEDLDLNELGELDPAYGYQLFVVNTLHAAYEGVAIGVAMIVSLPFGLAMAVALAVHNIPEAMIFTAVLRERGVKVLHAAVLAVATNLNQVLLAVVTYSVLAALPVLRPWALGFAFGSLVYLVLDELLPESYRQAGHTSIALVTLVAMGIVVALGGGIM
ncbi:MAG: ZIP family metal transporter [Gemmatimonadetes bacterium]|nr:ZIP family metal transporter [Gemmatimonadota bacterium]NNL30391.1 ZIP family metal transporter [Gemmatimonadota bacterium]